MSSTDDMNTMHSANPAAQVPSAAQVPRSGQHQPPTRQPAPSPGRGIVIALAIVGGLLLLIVIGGGVFSAVASLAGDERGRQTSTALVDDIHSLDIRAGSADFTVVFDDQGGPDTALLEVVHGVREWQMRNSESTLQIESTSRFPFGWLSIGPRPGQQVVLHLPSSLRESRLNADLDLSSGSFHIDAELGDVEVDLSSGQITVEGSARSFEGSVSSGALVIGLSGVREADIEVSSGRVSGELTGRDLRALELSVSSGKVDLGVPDQSYAVSSRVSSGKFDNQLRTDPSSRSAIEVGVSSGSVTLWPIESGR